MEREGKPSIQTQFQVADGKIVALQADPECREMSRMVADLNRRVLRVQTHGLEQTEEGRPRGFGVEVAREAAEDEAPGASGSAPFYTTADESLQQNDTALVQQYLEDVEEIEGKPGPVKRTVKRWVHGKPAGGHADSCCCRQVEAVAGKMTIAQASSMQDEAVDRLLVDVYFHPPSKRGISTRVLRRASEMSKRLSERVKSVARRISHRRTESHAGKSGSTREGVDEVAGAEVETVQLRQSRQPTRGPSDSEAERAREAGSMPGRQSQPKTDLEQKQAENGSEAAPRRESSDEQQFYSARSSLASSEERAGSSEDKGKLQSGHNVGVYQVLFEAEEENLDESNSNYQWPQQTSFTPHVQNRKANDTKEVLQEDKNLIGNQNEHSQCVHHKSIAEDDWQIKILQMDMAEEELNPEKDKSNFERSDQSNYGKSKSPVPDSLNGKNTGASGTHFKGERREQRGKASERKPDLQLPESDQHQNERRIVGSLDVFILNDSTEFEWEPISERSEEEVLASQRMGELEFEEDSLQNNADSKSSSLHSHIESTLRDERVLQDSGGSRKRDRNGPLHSKEVTEEPERQEQTTENVENGSKSVHNVKKGRRTI